MPQEQIQDEQQKWQEMNTLHYNKSNVAKCNEISEGSNVLVQGDSTESEGKNIWYTIEEW